MGEFPRQLLQNLWRGIRDSRLEMWIPMTPRTHDVVVMRHGMRTRSGKMTMMMVTIMRGRRMLFLTTPTEVECRDLTRTSIVRLVLALWRCNKSQKNVSSARFLSEDNNANDNNHNHNHNHNHNQQRHILYSLLASASNKHASNNSCHDVLRSVLIGFTSHRRGYRVCAVIKLGRIQLPIKTTFSSTTSPRGSSNQNDSYVTAQAFPFGIHNWVPVEAPICHHLCVNYTG